MISALHKMLYWWSNQEDRDGRTT